MRKLFEYNWQVRKDWLDWCEQLSEEQLVSKRTGGPGSILYTMYHIVDVEHSWISLLQGKETGDPPSPEHTGIQPLREFSERCHAEIAPFILSWNSDMELLILAKRNRKGDLEHFKYGEIMRHVLAHEIHHVGQLSVWAREIGLQPVTANLIRRGLF
ncbi:MAG: DinB family protein [Cohnella sp.]|nr:DinB family protein [Cohnella sp.]